MTAIALLVMTDDEVARFGRQSDAGFGALKTERGLLPLTAMDVDARVAGVIASIELAQTFVNTTGVAIEATYIFPLPDRAAVHRFRMEVAGRVVEGVIDERGAAREQYEEAIAAGHRAAITEEERPGVFTMRVGNLMPGEAATVRLSLVGPLPVDDGEVTFRFPLVVAPRYMPGSGLGGDQAGLGVAQDTSLVPDASRISPPVMLPGCPNPVRLGLRVALEDAALSEVASSLHAVTTSSRDARIVEVQPGERLDRDFILRWHVDGEQLRSSFVCADDADGKGGTFLLTMVPPSTQTVAAKPRDVVFVVDRSGSMQGWKMVAARRAVARMIDTLTSRDTFGVIAFDDRIEHIPAPGLLPANDRTRFRAVEALAKVDARGGTEMAVPLRDAVMAIAGGHDDREHVVVLVTDGQVGNEDHILRELAPIMRNVRMFTLGIDQAVNAGFLRRLASTGGGLCELVESEDRLDAVMAKVHRRIGMPIATELALRGIGIDIDNATVAPRRLPDVYAGAPVTVVGRYRGPAPAHAEVHLDGTSFGDPLREKIARTPSRERPGTWLAASWARAYIRDLEDQYATGERHVEPRIVEVSKRFSVLSRFTAFIAVDRSEVANKGGRLHQVVQPVDAPAGWDMLSGPAAPGGGGARRAPPTPGYPAGARALRGAPATPGGSMPPPMAPIPTAAAPAMRPPRPTESSPLPPPPPGYSGGPPLASPPPAPSANRAPMPKQRAVDKLERFDDLEEAPVQAVAPPKRNPYFEQLANLARELESLARGGANPTAMRMLRQRLVEWAENWRSTDGNTDLAAAVEALTARLGRALAAADLATEALAIAAELAAFATGAPPPPAPKKSRPAFWK